MKRIATAAYYSYRWEDNGGSGKDFDPDALRKLQIADLTQIMATAVKGVPVFKEYKPETDEETKEEDVIAQRAPEPGNIYFYHPDHLGTSTYLTDANGQPYQFFINLPFGEIVAKRRFIEHQNKIVSW